MNFDGKEVFITGVSVKLLEMVCGKIIYIPIFRNVTLQASK
jgi:hypothetical protein